MCCPFVTLAQGSIHFFQFRPRGVSVSKPVAAPNQEKLMRHRSILMLCIASMLSLYLRAEDKMPERWNYVKANLSNDTGLADFLNVLKASSEVGCTHILMPEGRFMRFAEDRDYLARVAKVKQAAKELSLTIVPSVASVGYSGRYLHYDANLAAGLPVKDMVFVVKDGKALPDESGTLDVSKLSGDDKQKSGTLKAQPFHHYRLSFSLVGAVDAAPSVEVTITTSSGKRTNSRSDPIKKKGADRWHVLTTFNSLEGDELKINLANKTHKIEDLKIEPAGLLLFLNRASVPLTVTSEDGKTVYEAGKDFKPFEDPCLAVKPFPGEVTIEHAPAQFDLTEGSRIKNGDKLKLSFWHTLQVGSDQVVISMAEPRVREILEQEIVNCQKVWNTNTFFLNYDEIRLAGWEPLPGGRTLKPGELLAEHFKKTYDFVRKLAPDAKLYTWSDMFTPHHNARPFSVKGYYYLVNGNWDGSWEGVPKDVTILNWYSPKPDNIKFFADRGHAQVLCGFYDGTGTEKLKNNIANWKTVSSGQPNILGFMYTTWKGNYKELKEYFALLDSYDKWAQPQRAKTEAEPGVPVP
jgi:hypothetical protein